VAARPGAPKPPRRRRWRRRLLIALALLVILPTGLYFFADSRVGRVDAFPAARTRPAATPGQDWLIVGSDSREGLSKAERKRLATGRAIGKRTDTMMLLHIPKSGKPTLVSLPRDSYVPIPGHGSNRLNAAFAFGGAPLLIQTVEDITNIRIDHYAEVGFGGVFDVVNAIGGVEICVKGAMKDPKAGLNIKKGCQNLDGAEALGYSRSRASTRGDLDRVDHQRELMMALMKKAASPSTLLNPLHVWPMVMKGTGSLTIDGGDHLLDLARLAFAAKALGSGGVTTTVPIGGTPTINGAEVLTWDKSRSDPLFDALRTDRRVPKSSLSK
jgi:LCP family protein required for cell wall assembly